LQNSINFLHSPPSTILYISEIVSSPGIRSFAIRENNLEFFLDDGVVKTRIPKKWSLFNTSQYEA
jgi:hypothetical protein